LLKLGAAGNASIVDFVNVRLVGGLGFYILGSALWIFAMARAPLSLVYPFTALTFVLVILASVFLLGERLTSTMIIGSGLILSGIVCFTLGAAR
jgi:undecaprenyl phosphate-alpha-L-ara4N flippase subunit ArnE